jgi:hypothetical protein
MQNRYGNEYEFVAVDSNTYRVTGELKYWRYGGHPGDEGVDPNDLGFADPSGGPFISQGHMIAGRKVTRIRLVGGDLLLDVE